jgi:Mitochondrial inner membrane protein
VAFEAELRHQLALQTAAHSDHLVAALRSQRAQLNADFESQLTDRVEKEKYRQQAEVAGSLTRMKAVEAAIEGREGNHVISCYLVVELQRDKDSC